MRETEAVSAVNESLNETARSLSRVVGTLRTTSKQVGQVSQAVSSAGKELTKAGSSTRKLKGQVRDLFSFDQINRLSAAASTASKSSGRRAASRRSGGSGGRTTQLKAEVTWLERLRRLLSELTAPLKRFWNVNGGNTLKAFQNLRSHAAQLSAILKSGLKWGYDHVLAPLGKWTLSSGVPAVLDLFANVIRILTADCKLFAPVVSRVWEWFFEPMLSWNGKLVAAALRSAADGVGWLADRLEGLESLLSGGSITAKLKEFGSNAWNHIISGLSSSAGAMRDAFHGLLEGLFAGGAQLSARNPMTVPVQLSSSAGELWVRFAQNWGNDRTVKVTDKLKNGAVSLWSGFKAAWGENRVVKAANSLKNSAGSLWSGFKDAWGSRAVSIKNTLSNSAATLWNNLKNGWKNKKLNLTVTYSTEVGALKTAVYKALGLAGWPSLKFAARGGIVSGASLFGNTLVGEDGMEAIVPLERHTEWMDRVAERLAGRLGGGNGAGTQPIVVQVVLDGRVVGQTAVDFINRQARSSGVHPLGAYL